MLRYPRQTAQAIVNGTFDSLLPASSDPDVLDLARSYLDIINHIATTSEAFTRLERNLKDLELHLRREADRPVAE